MAILWLFYGYYIGMVRFGQSDVYCFISDRKFKFLEDNLILFVVGDTSIESVDVRSLEILL